MQKITCSSLIFCLFGYGSALTNVPCMPTLNEILELVFVNLVICTF